MMSTTHAMNPTSSISLAKCSFSPLYKGRGALLRAIFGSGRWSLDALPKAKSE